MTTCDPKVLAGIKEGEKRSQETCQRKRRYSDEFGARAHGAQIMEREKDHARLFIYQCRWCRGWHLTKQDQGRLSASANYYLQGVKK